jgi:hypothetical protein
MDGEIESAPVEQVVTTTFIPRVSFTGFPDGVTPVQFMAGVESIPVAPDFAQLMRDKGLVADDEPTAETV